MSNARNKLNAGTIHGILLVAGVVAFLGQSWPLFWFLVAVFMATSFMAGDLRLPPENNSKRKPR
jgi:hypothetical protein